MARYNHERLSGQDTSFLRWETPNLHMRVACTQILDLGPPRRAFFWPSSP
jgi:hypothetical protein